MSGMIDNNIDKNVKIAIDMINLGEIEKGVNLLYDLSKIGCSLATRKLIELYAGGDDIPLSEEQILSWLLSEADSNEIWIERLLGIMYLNGKGVNKNFKEAKMWFEMAAVQGDPTSQVYLGWLYEYGYEVNKSDRQSVYWYSKAAEQKNVTAMKRLARYFWINMKYDEAIRWYEEAAKQHDADAEYELGFIYFVGIYGKENENRAIEWFECSANHGSDIGRKTVEAYKIMSENGEGSGLYQLGCWFEDKKIIEKAIAFYQKAAECGDTDAQFRLGQIYLNGKDAIKSDYDKAFKLLGQAADKGNADAQNSLGYMYSCGYGVKENHKKAYKLFKKAAKQGQINAINNLAIAYEIGYGTHKNYKKAKQWYSLAKTMGDRNASSAIIDIEKNEIWVKKRSAEKRKGWIIKLFAMILIGIIINILFAIGAENIVSSTNMGIYLLLVGCLYICGVIIPHIIDWFIGTEISENAKFNKCILSVVCVIEFILFIIMYICLKKELVHECDYVKVTAYNPIAVFGFYLLGIIILNFRIFSCANKIHNPMGIIILSVAISALYSVLLYTVLLDVILNIVILLAAVAGILLILYAILGWFFMWY